MPIAAVTGLAVGAPALLGVLALAVFVLFRHRKNPPPTPTESGSTAELEAPPRAELEPALPAEAVTREVYEMPEVVRSHRIVSGLEADESHEEKELGTDSDSSVVDWETPDTIC